MTRTPWGLIVILSGNLLCLLALLLIPTEALIVRTWVLVVLATLTLVLYLGQRYSAGFITTVELMSSAGVLIAFLLPSLYLCSVDFDFLTDGNVSYRHLLPEVAYAALLGQSFFFAGHALRIPRSDVTLFCKSRTPMMADLSVLDFARIFFILVLVVWMARALLLLSGSYYHVFRSEFQEQDVTAYSALAQLGGLNLIVISGAWLHAFARSGNAYGYRWMWFALVLTTGELLWYLPSGSREPVLFLGISIFASYVLLRRRLPIKALVVAVPVAVGLIVVLGFYRGLIGDTALSTRQIDYGNVAKSLLESESAIDEAVKSGAWLFVASRPSEARPVAAILDGVPNVVPYQFGKTYLSVLWIPVPRLFYEDKPSINIPINKWFFTDDVGSSPLTLIGEGFLNFGWAGICTVGLLAGWLSGAYDRFMWIRMRSDPMGIWAAIYAGTSVIALRLYAQTLGIWLSTFAKAVILAWLITILARYLTFNSKLPADRSLPPG